MMRNFRDDAETIQRWQHGCGYVAVVILWAIAFILASGILR